DTSRMTQGGLRALAVGDTWVLPDGAGSVTFDGVAEWASFSVAQDPGKGLALGSVVVALLGLMLSLFVPRRRVWVRATPQPGGTTLVEVAGLARTETGGLDDEVERLLERLRTAAPEARPEHPEDTA
ncbi:MAG: cytochrome c biogenesis protein ResB, partial [Actinomycetia bacterium]|nr:cytochrome c biogenesis protein ResB [Actinomycetes bacterium]